MYLKAIKREKYAKSSTILKKCARVYDKKLLWRAQLFIDETKNADGTASGNADWNNENRWTYAQGNNWDRDWFDYDNDGITAEAGPYNGGQCPIKPWTSIYTYFPAHEAWAIQQGYPLEVHNAVAYSLGCDDTPYFFNMDMVEQKDVIRTYYNTNNNEVVGPNPSPTDHRDWANWNDTVAPGDEWGNYMQGIPSPRITPEPVEGTPTPTPGFNTQPIIFHALKINNQDYYPYLPGFSSFPKLDSDESTRYQFENTKYAAGVECQGLITRSAGYGDNNYVLDQELDSTRRTWTVTTGAGIDINNWSNVGWPITTYDTAQTSLVIPGDVININGHVGIVYKVEYDTNRVAQRDDIYILESYGGPMSIYKERTWYDFRAATGTTFCNIYRLKTE